MHLINCHGSDKEIVIKQICHLTRQTTKVLPYYIRLHSTFSNGPLMSKKLPL